MKKHPERKNEHNRAKRKTTEQHYITNKMELKKKTTQKKR
jgi:hypothetical protein